MSAKAVLVSLAVHVLIAGAALSVATRTRLRKPTAVTVVETKKKEPEKEKPKPPPPPRTAEKPKPQRAAPAAAPSRAEPEPLDTGLTLGNADDGPGIPLPWRGPANGAPAESNFSVRKSAPPRRSTEDECREPPSKPTPAVRNTEIEYTPRARSEGVEGRLVLRLTIGANGSVVKVEVVSSVDPSLDAAAIAAVKSWTFKPATRCGKPMAGGVYTLARRFELGD